MILKWLVSEMVGGVKEFHMLKNIALERVNNLIKIINVHRLIIDQLHK